MKYRYLGRSGLLVSRICLVSGMLRIQGKGNVRIKSAGMLRLTFLCLWRQNTIGH